MSNDEQDCQICFESITSDTAFKGMTCNHLFHSECLKEFINQYETDKKIHSCPTCYKPYNFKLLFNGKSAEDVQQASNLKKYNELRSNVKCAICLEDYDDQNNLPTGLPSCSHIYHQKCIQNWLSQYGVQELSGRCPQCQRSFEESTLKPRNDIFASLLKLKELSTPNALFNVFLIDFSNNLRPLQISKTTTVAQFTEMASKELDIPQDNIVFTSKGRQFSLKGNTEKMLDDYNIQTNDRINVSKRWNGGYNNEEKLR